MNYIISMPDNWKPEDCYLCPIKCQSVHGVNPECYLTGAKEVEEVKTFKTSRGHAYTGSASVVYAVKDK